MNAPAHAGTQAPPADDDDPREVLRRFGLVETTAGLEVVWRRRQRHQTALVAGARRQWFVKRRGGALRHGPVRLDGELAFHRLLVAGDLPTGLAAYVPSLDAADATTLVCVGLGDHAVAGLDPDTTAIPLEEVARHLGQALALTHASDTSVLAGRVVTTDRPVMTFGHVSPEMVGRGPQGFEDLVRLVQGEPRLNGWLRRLRSSWRAPCLTHGDIKLDNVLVAPTASAPFPVALVDWELAGLGDPSWDCGSFVGSLYHQAVERLELGIATDAYQRDGAQITGTVIAFWDRYAAVRADQGWPVDSHELDRMLAWAGFWMIQRIALLLPMRRTVDAQDVAALHVAASLLAHVEPASLDIQEARR